jgi:hypothetical protein
VLFKELHPSILPRKDRLINSLPCGHLLLRFGPGTTIQKLAGFGRESTRVEKGDMLLLQKVKEELDAHKAGSHILARFQRVDCSKQLAPVVSMPLTTH